MADSNSVVSDFQFIAGSIVFASLAVLLFVLFNRKPEESEPKSKNGTSCDIIEVKRPSLPMDVLIHFEHLIQSFPKTCQVTLAEANLLEVKTRGQGSSSLWKVERSRRLTASNFGSIAKRRKLVDSRFVDRIKGLGRPVMTRYMSVGVSNEALAVDLYVESRSVLTFDIGFCVNPGLPIIGATPDRLVYDYEVCEFGLLEIKTLAKAKELNLSIREAIDSKRTKCCLKRRNDKVYLDPNHDYHYQVQGQLGITRLKWCDFFVDAGTDHFCQRIQFDEIFFAKMTQKLVQFYTKYFRTSLEE